MRRWCPSWPSIARSTSTPSPYISSSATTRTPSPVGVLLRLAVAVVEGPSRGSRMRSEVVAAVAALALRLELRTRRCASPLPARTGTYALGAVAMVTAFLGGAAATAAAPLLAPRYPTADHRCCVRAPARMPRLHCLADDRQRAIRAWLLWRPPSLNVSGCLLECAARIVSSGAVEAALPSFARRHVGFNSCVA